MNTTDLRELIRRHIGGDITPEEHRRLHAELEANAASRALFREMIDLDVGLRTLAAEGGEGAAPRGAAVWKGAAGYALAASALVAVLVWRFGATREPAGGETPQASRPHLGTFGPQRDCVWRSPAKAVPGGRLAAGKLSLRSGVGEVTLDTGTRLVLEGPCELDIAAIDAAELWAGKVVVSVAELSDGFTLKTPDATITDEGTEYAVSLDDDATEVHVFDGSVIWEPAGGPDAAQRIASGEARRYARSAPRAGARVPFGKRRFVRRVEERVREGAGDALSAYDGFENLAGRVRRGRSGFGWSGGWRSARRGRGKLGDIVDAPDDAAFGFKRADRRMLRLTHGEALRRDFAQPHRLESGDVLYVSFLFRRSDGGKPPADRRGRFFELALYPVGEPRRRHRNRVTFGVTSGGLPFVKGFRGITASPPATRPGEWHFAVGKIVASDFREAGTFLRVYRPGEAVDLRETRAWTAAGRANPGGLPLAGVRISVGPGARYEMDELRVGRTWAAVIAPSR